MRRQEKELENNSRICFLKGSPRQMTKLLTAKEAPGKELSGFLQGRNSLFEGRFLTGREKSSRAREERNNPCLSDCIYPMGLLPGFLLATKKPSGQSPDLKSRNETILPRQTSQILTYSASLKANLTSRKKADCQSQSEAFKETDSAGSCSRGEKETLSFFSFCMQKNIATNPERNKRIAIRKCFVLKKNKQAGCRYEGG